MLSKLIYCNYIVGPYSNCTIGLMIALLIFKVPEAIAFGLYLNDNSTRRTKFKNITVSYIYNWCLDLFKYNTTDILSIFLNTASFKSSLGFGICIIICYRSFALHNIDLNTASCFCKTTLTLAWYRVKLDKLGNQIIR